MFGKRLRELRIENNLTQRQLADKIGVDFRTVSFWETGRFEPNLEQIVKLCAFFSVSADYLLGIKDE